MAGRDAVTGAPVQTLRPHPVTTTDSSVVDTSQGTVHLILGGGGTDAPLDSYGIDQSDGLRQAKVFTRPNRPAATSTPGVFARAGADALEDATWSAMRDTSTGYGIAVFDVHPGEVRGGMTSITVRYFHARRRRSGQPGHRPAGRADAGLHRVRELHPGPPPLRRLAGPATGAGRGQRRGR